MEELIISFQGLDADEGRIDAFAGIESAAGLARALTLVGHYAATGVVRHRFPFDDTVRFYLDGTEEGSFNWKIVIQYGAPLALGLGTNALYDLIKLTWGKAIGQETPALEQPVEALNKDKSGDIDALVEAIEPALKKAHYGVGETASRIVIQEKIDRKIIITFDQKSKNYLMDSIEAEDAWQDVTISALNVNDRTGRAYFHDLKRTIPFRVPKDADPKTIPILSAALDRYANKDGAATRVYFTRVEAIDGRLKRIVILRAMDVGDME